MVSGINCIKYGKFIDVDFKESNFVKTMTLLQSIDPKDNPRYVYMSRSNREKLYKVSPAFNELYSELDAPNAKLSGWKKPGCERLNIECDDYSGPWFFGRLEMQ